MEPEKAVKKITDGRLFRVILTLVLVLPAACATSPLGRRQLKLVPAVQMDAMGVQAFTQLKQTTPVESSPALNAYVRCIALPLAELAEPGSKPSDWEVVVFKNAEPNAFALPGRKIGVHTGLLTVAKTDGELAAVLGHEVGHVLAGHGNERVSENLVVNLGLVATAELLSGADGSKKGGNKGLLMAALGLGAQFGVLLPHSRDHETEADIIGLRLMARAGFDPHESVSLWRNMIRASGGLAPPEFLSTHPASENRIARLERAIPEVLDDYQAALRAGFPPKCGPR